MHHKFSRSFRFQGLLETTRTPWVLTFSVRPSCVGWRTSRLQRSTLTFRGMRSSNRRAIASMRHPTGLRKTGRMGVGGGNDRDIIRLPGAVWAEIPNPRPASASKAQTLHRYGRNGYTLVLPV